MGKGIEMKSKKDGLGEGESYTLKKTVPSPCYPLQKAMARMLQGRETLTKSKLLSPLFTDLNILQLGTGVMLGAFIPRRFLIFSSDRHGIVRRDLFEKAVTQMR
jgi:hypothetical protein